jgi:uncharacterized membrane protein
MTVLILSTQRRDDELASYREQLTLELAILGEQKSAKVIELLEELRRDDPTIRNRIDHDAAAMSAPADPNSHAGMAEPGVEARVSGHQAITNPSVHPTGRDAL